MYRIVATIVLFLFTAVFPPYVYTADLPPIKLGMSAAFTGPSRALGLELYKGAMAYFDQVNKAGGIKGHKIVIAAYDDGYNPDPTVRNTIRLVEEDDVLTLFGYVGTPTTTRMLPLLNLYSNRDILLLFPFTGAQPLREAPYADHIYHLRGSYFQETRGLVDNFVAIGRKRIGVFYQIDAYGRSGWDGVRRALRRYNLDIVSEATYRRGSTFEQDMTPQVEILRQAEPDVIISVGSYSACAAFIRDARNDGWDVPIANLSFVNTDRMIQQLLAISGGVADRYTRNLVNSQVVPNYEDISIAAVQEYREAMGREGKLLPNGYPPTREQQDSLGFISFEGFLNAKLLCRILAAMEDPTDRTKLRSAIDAQKRIDLGIGKLVSFGPEQHQGLSEIYFTTVENGKIANMVTADWARMAR